MKYNYVKIGVAGFSCSCCGQILAKDAEVSVCPDCGAVTCKACCEAGAMEDHECEPDDEN